MEHAPPAVGVELREVKPPKPATKRIGTFVDGIATEMSMSSGITASRVTRPSTIRVPQTIR
jgi:hypothetical protein